LKILYHHRTQAEDGQAVHIRAMQQAFRDAGCEVREFALVRRGTESAPRATRRSWSAMALVPRFARELLEYQYGRYARPRLERILVEERCDALYERYAFGNEGGVQAARSCKKPIVLEVNSPMVLELSKTRGLSFPRHARRVEERIFRAADRVCVVTRVLGDMLVEMGVEPARILVTQNGVHLAAYAEPGDPAARAAARVALRIPPALEQRVLLGFVGYYRPWHRLDLVLEALASRELADAALVLVGEGPAHEGLMARAKELGVLERVHHAGRRSHEDIPRLLPAFDVALVPAINPYASPLKLFEYMAAGLACVAPDQPNLREVLRHDHDALLVPPGEGARLQSALARLVSDAGLRRRLGLAARRTILERDLTWDGNARRVLQALEDLRRA
jgi:glycosyltransferase involved in cell wall biosynthesis